MFCGEAVPERRCDMCHRTKKKNVAKERLRLMIDARKKKLDENAMNELRQEIGLLVTKYIDIEPENIEIKIILKES